MLRARVTVLDPIPSQKMVVSYAVPACTTKASDAEHALPHEESSEIYKGGADVGAG
jgi:hypothetical protein